MPEGVDRVIAYACKTLTKCKRIYSTTKRELSAKVHLKNHFKTYLLCRKSVIVTHQRALVWLYNLKDVEGMIARWFEKMGEFKLKKGITQGKTYLMWTVCHAFKLK